MDNSENPKKISIDINFVIQEYQKRLSDQEFAVIQLTAVNNQLAKKVNDLKKALDDRMKKNRKCSDTDGK